MNYPFNIECMVTGVHLSAFYNSTSNQNLRCNAHFISVGKSGDAGKDLLTTGGYDAVRYQSYSDITVLCCRDWRGGQL